MNILVIGNGFDLAHGLPTTYKDFLDFCVTIKDTFITFVRKNKNYPSQKYIETLHMDDTIKDMLLSAYETKTVTEISPSFLLVQTSTQLLNEFFLLIDGNAWLQYFLNCPSYIGKNWVDFESEISKVIQSLDAVRLQVESGGSIDAIKSDDGKLAIAIWKASGKNFKNIFENSSTIDDFSEYLSEELEKITRALEIYIAGFVHAIRITRKVEDIEKLNPDHVLSFNYSSTYQRIYGNDRKIIYNYIHGNADVGKNTDTCDMVLGIDEYLSDDRKNTDLEFLPFKNFFRGFINRQEMHI